ncbi:MAG TPA: AMP-binding protein [Steroidobacteraceae bacterium]|nr:AMP-binding protein [Steroidobacteraceae bacterium]
METLVDFDRMSTLGAIAAYHAHERPRAIALSFEGRQTNFAEFDYRTNQVAQALLAQGITYGRRICYVGKNSDHYFELLFGVGLDLGGRRSLRSIEHSLRSVQGEPLSIGLWRDVVVLVDRPPRTLTCSQRAAE